MLNRNDVIERMRALGGVLKEPYEIVAVGGTSLALHGLKEQTRDVDFIVERGDILRFADKYKEVYDGVIHLAEPGTCFAIYMPADYMAHTIKIIKSGNVSLHTLGMADSIITKATRFNDRDRIDLQKCRRSYNNDVLRRISDYSLKTEHMNNVKAAMTEIFGIPRGELDEL